MKTDALIDALSRDVRPIPRAAVGRRLAVGLVGGGLLSALLLTMSAGLRPDLAAAMAGGAFWMKLGYVAVLALLAIGATARFARPGLDGSAWLRMTVAPALLLAGFGAWEMLRTPSTQWLALWLGQSWLLCPWLVLFFSIPVFLGLLWSFRRLAPTDLRGCGAAAGFAAGASGAIVYSLHCQEGAAIFVLSWYSLGILLATLAGALLGPRLLRW